jgi:hypothetical protein
MRICPSAKGPAAPAGAFEYHRIRDFRALGWAVVEIMVFLPLDRYGRGDMAGPAKQSHPRGDYLFQRGHGNTNRSFQGTKALVAIKTVRFANHHFSTKKSIDPEIKAYENNA